MIVHAAEKRRRRVFADILDKQVGASGMLVEEGRYVVNEPAHKYKRARE